MVVLTSPAKSIFCSSDKPYDSSWVADPFAWSSSHACSAPKKSLEGHYSLECRTVRRNLLLNKKLVVPGWVSVILYTVNNKQRGLIRHASEAATRLQRLLESQMPTNSEALGTPGLQACRN